MTVRFPSLDGRVLDGFQANLAGRGPRWIELWETSTSVPLILRWRVHDEPLLYGEAVADRAVLLPRAEASIEQIMDRLRTAGQSLSLENDFGEFFTVRLDNPVVFWQRSAAFRDLLTPLAEVEPDYILRASPQEFQDRIDHSEDELSWIGARERWPPGIDTPEVVVVLIDTGVDLHHPSLRNRIARDGTTGAPIGWNLVQNGNPPADDHYESHGTYCAGLIAGEPSADFLGGVLRQGRIIPIKALDYQGLTTGTVAAEAVRLASATGTKVISASWTNVNDPTPLALRIAEAGNAGCLFVTAAGNYGIDLDRCPLYPASFGLPNLLVVGGLSDALEPVPVWGWGSQTVHLSAPGLSILSALRSEFGIFYPFQVLGGTSAATAIVAAAAALVQSAALAVSSAYLAPSELKRILVQSTKPLGRAYSYASCSAGYVDLRQAIGMVTGSFRPRNPPRCP